jgi:hypothetical protein
LEGAIQVSVLPRAKGFFDLFLRFHCFARDDKA